MSGCILIRNGKAVSAEITVNSKRLVDVRCWRPGTDETLLADRVDIVSIRPANG